MIINKPTKWLSRSLILIVFCDSVEIPFLRKGLEKPNCEH